MRMTTPSPGEIGLRHYAVLTGRPGPTNDKAPGQGGLVGRSRSRPSQFSQPRRRLPAYARELAELRQQGMRPKSNTVIVRLDCWPAGDRPLSVRWPQVVCPPHALPASLDFCFLADLEVVVAYWRSKSEPSRLKSLLRCILTADPRILIVLDMEAADGTRAWFVKSMSNGLEVSL